MLYNKIEKHLGTQIEIQIVSEEKNVWGDIDALFAYCKDFENEFSRFIPNSPLSVLNTIKKLKVSDRFLEIFSLALEYQKITDGAFSPFINLKSLGYSHSFETGKFQAQDTGSQEQEYSISNNILTLGQNTNLDFGGIGKGFLVDVLTQELEKKGYTNFLVNAGGDINLRGYDNFGEKWSIGIENPFDIEKDLGVFTVENMSINTSGSYRRNWNIENKQYHHIINPETGKNANTYVSVTLISTSCTKGDCLTKGVWHTPFEELAGYFKRQSIDGVVVCSDGQIFASPKMFEEYEFTIL